MFQAFNQGPNRLIQWRWNTAFLAKFHDAAVQRGYLSGPPRNGILQHARFVMVGHLTGMIDQLNGVTVERDAQCIRHSYTFGHQS